MTALFSTSIFFTSTFSTSTFSSPSGGSCFSILERLMSDLAGQYQGDVVGLLVGADPGVESEHDLTGDYVQGLIAVTGDHLHHAFFAELAEVVLRLGDTV